MVRELNVNLVLSQENQGWILEKMARRLSEHLPEWGVRVSLSDARKGNVDLNHWMSYAFANEGRLGLASMFITHVDDPYKVALIRNELSEGIDIGICMSSESCQYLESHGIPREKLCFILPAHDGLAKPRRLRIGVTTRLYRDGRKREKLLVRLASEIRLDAFQFQVFGAGWEDIIPHLEHAGALVEYFPGTADYQSDYAEILGRIAEFDYYLYTGNDEGSLGTLDALAAGAKTIVTAQGFHLDLGSAITHFFNGYDQLRQIFIELAADVSRRTATAADLGWSRFAREHADVWRNLLQGMPQRSWRVGQLATKESEGSPMFGLSRSSYWLRSLNPARALSALSHTRALSPVRKLLRRIRSKDNAPS